MRSTATDTIKMAIFSLPHCQKQRTSFSMWFSCVLLSPRSERVSRNGRDGESQRTSEWFREREKGRHCDKCLGDISWLYIRRHYCNPGQRITCHIMAWNKFIQLRKFISGHVSKLVATMHFWHRIISLSALARPLILMPFASKWCRCSKCTEYGKPWPCTLAQCAPRYSMLFHL